nr:MAG TPA: hypothetical protein [Caudoviricetes sp.]
MRVLTTQTKKPCSRAPGALLKVGPVIFLHISDLTDSHRTDF